jgi:transposase
VKDFAQWRENRPGPYSYDLRVRVVAAVENGMTGKEASQTFGLHRDTLTTWLARKEATGDVQAKTGDQHGHWHKIPDPAQFEAFLPQQGDATLEEVAAAWGGVQRMTIWRQLRKLGDPQKKRPFGMPSGMRR